MTSGTSSLAITVLPVATGTSFTALTVMFITADVTPVPVSLTVYVKLEFVESFNADVNVKSASWAAVIVIPLVTVTVPAVWVSVPPFRFNPVIVTEARLSPSTSVKLKSPGPITSGTSSFAMTVLPVATGTSFTAFTVIFITADVTPIPASFTAYVKLELAESFKAEVKVKSAS